MSAIDPAYHRLPVPRRRGIAGRLIRTLALVGMAALVAVAVGSIPSGSVGRRGSDQGRLPPRTAAGLPFAPGQLVVGYSGPVRTVVAEVRRLAGAGVRLSPRGSLTPRETVLQLPAAANVSLLAAKVASLPGVRYATPDYLAHAAGSWLPDDTGSSGRAKGWEQLQWNFLAASGVNAPQAWANLFADHRPGASGVVIAVLDTGIAFRDWQNFKRSPDFGGTRFSDPCDLVAGAVRGGRCTDPFALDREGHGTFVAGTIAEATNNHYGLTGLAYGSTIMPVRVLDASGNGSATTIANGIRYAVRHGAQVINLSIEFSPGTGGRDIRDVVSAIGYAHARGVVVVGAAGNDQDTTLDYPAALPDVISVGATTRDRCLAVYSDVGKGLSLVAPGGGSDAAGVAGSVCHPARNLPDIYQMTFTKAAAPGLFSMPRGWFGTSMAAPAVSAAAAMVIASGVIGPRPSPDAIMNRLEATASPLGTGVPNNDYGYGLINIGAATSRGGPLRPPSPPYSLLSQS